ncbi:MAG: PAS domain-containing sensor histidine kinase [Methylibium sp.]|uniref:PAS domain-containing sensor histidine kinase n=1 Tax=Methylibium sp. TaxID=2067992 RepID=UPI0017CBAADA|nr:PAS domain-containing sensor histidine kinase [Methylibium sp.]MBA3598893.1 PAS domain-containing sensor histidine kinase [Methylibium sp.]
MNDTEPSAADAEQLLELWRTQLRSHALLLLDAEARVVSALGGVEETLGYRPDELQGQPLERLFTAEDRALGLDRHEVVTARATGTSADDRWHLRKDGSRVWIDGVLTALQDADGRVVGFAKIMRDRTDLRAQIETLENELAALAGGQEQRDIFIATLAHELRNPLMPLSNAAQLIRMMASDDRLRFPLQVIDRQLAQLKRLVDDMMDVTRLDVDRLELHLQPLVLQAALGQAVELCRPGAQDRQLALAALMPPAPIEIEADPMRFEQIIVNLLNNAIKYTPSGGHIWVKCTVEATRAVIRVEDNGNGIAADMLPRIFDLFTQESSAGSAASGGLGIGLALVKSLVALHHGIVEVRSEGPGKGSEFTVRLPLVQSAPTPA